VYISESKKKRAESFVICKSLEGVTENHLWLLERLLAFNFNRGKKQISTRMRLAGQLSISQG
jgi:hypothetical protein